MELRWSPWAMVNVLAGVKMILSDSEEEKEKG